MTCGSLSLHLTCLIRQKLCNISTIKDLNWFYSRALKKSLVWHLPVFYYTCRTITIVWLTFNIYLTTNVVMSNVPYVFNKYTLHCSSLYTECCFLFVSFPCRRLNVHVTFRRAWQEGNFVYLICCVCTKYNHIIVSRLVAENPDRSFVFF